MIANEHQDHLAIDVKIIFKEKFRNLMEKFTMARYDKILFVRINNDYGCRPKLNSCNGWIKLLILFLSFFFIYLRFYVHSPRMRGEHAFYLMWWMNDMENMIYS